MVKRIFLFMLTNVLVVVSVSLVMGFLGIGNYLTAQGIDYSALMAFCLVWGFVGSGISLLLSKFMAKTMMGVKIVDDRGQYGDLVRKVHVLAKQAGINKMPEVGVYDSPEVNAFATGPSKNNALVAVSTGLLQQMNADEVEGVLAHEIAHVANGDMVTMALVQGVVNAFVMFFARIIAWGISQNVREENRYMTQFMVTFLLEMVLGVLGMIVVCSFSRYREFRADRGGAQYAGKQDMIAALQRLANNTRKYDEAPAMAAFKISGGVGQLFSTHPPLEKRIAALQSAAI